MARYILILMLVLSFKANAEALNCDKSDINVDLTRLLGRSENICDQYGGKVLLVVNVASHCGYTPQYEGLEALYRKHHKDGLVILGFPSGDFGGQEFDDAEKIQKFCKLNFGVSFPMFSRTSVRGPSANPLFKQLAEKTGNAPSWNFNKYLIDRSGKAVMHFPSDISPESPSLQAALKELL